MPRYAFAGALAAVFLIFGPSAQAVDIVWDGGDGEWNDLNGKWNGGQVSVNVFGRTDGLEVGSGEIGTDVFIRDGNVTYDPNTFGDFRFRNNNAGEIGGTLTIGNGAAEGDGASLTMNTVDGDVDGQWTQFNTEELNLDGGTFRRGFMPPAQSGGVFSFNGIRSGPNSETAINITNGGRIENNGQLTFGWYTQNDPGKKVHMTINDGHLDLTGGDNWDALDGAAGGAGNADLHFQIGWDEVLNQPLDQEYSINFTGPGSITVDHSGILVVVQTGPTQADFDFDTITMVRSYEDIWDMGILQANGQSGLTEAEFSDFFSTTGMPGEDDYVLTSLVGTVTGDFHNDGLWDCTDINALSAAIASGSTDLSFDMNGDGAITGGDIEDPGVGWLAVGGANNPGATGGNPFLNADSNLDGTVDGPDFTAWNANKFGAGPVSWCGGNWNSDGFTDGPDFLIWNDNKFQSSDGGGSLVPEPSSLALLLGMLAAAGFRRRRRNA